MEKDVRVTIKGVQKGLVEDIIQNEAFGRCYYRNNSHYLVFDNNELIDRLKISKGQVYIKNKKGRSKMVFKEKEETSTIYHTPHGDLEFQIYTDYIKKEKKEDIIAIKLCYTLSSGKNRISVNEVVIIIEPV